MHLDLTEAGLGLGRGVIRLVRTTPEQVAAGSVLRDRVAEAMAGVGVRVEHIGSTSVPDLLAKPIVDLAVGLSAADALAQVTTVLEAAGWDHRGDAGDSGGHVFVLEARPSHRVAHLHIVALGGSQWRDYLRLRDVLRASGDARARYGSEKARLAEAHPTDRTAYTDGKDEIVGRLLADARQS